MAHRLSSITIINFKSIINESFPLRNFTPLVGVNNAGKSNILRAIFWLLQGEKLSNEHFNDNTQPITVEGIIDGIGANILAILPANQRNAIQPYVINDQLKIKRSSSIGQSPTLTIFDPANIGTANEWRTSPTGIPQALEAIFPEPIVINAMDNSEEDVTKSKNTTTIGKLIAQIIQPMQHQHGQKIQAVFKKLNILFDADSNKRANVLKEFDKNASSKVQDFFPGVNLKLHVPTPEIKEYLKQGTIKVYETNITQGKDFNSLGHGAQRSIQMALIRCLAESTNLNAATPTTTLLLIDEPELYLHPQALEILRLSLKKLSSRGYQVIFTTHSPMMIFAADIHDTLLIYKTQALGTIKRPTLRGTINSLFPNSPSQIELLFSLSNSSKILFAEKVILTEGATELRIMPQLFSKICGRTLGQNKIGLIQQGGVANTSKTIAVLSALGIPSKAIVDLDYAFQRAVNDGYLQANDTDLVSLLNMLPALSRTYNFNLNGGLPSRGGSKTPEEAYNIIASKRIAKPYIKNLHDKLLQRNIWLWTKGSIEKHLGLTQKNEQAWATYNQNLETQTLKQAVADLTKIKKLVSWLNS